jgi:hypothetical protein
MVFTSLQNLAAYRGLVRSFRVPTSDPLYVPDLTATNAAALENRSFIYDDALAIIVYSMAGNFAAAAKIVKQLNYFLDHPGYLASRVLENAEDGSTALVAERHGGDLEPERSLAAALRDGRRAEVPRRDRGRQLHLRGRGAPGLDRRHAPVPAPRGRGRHVRDLDRRDHGGR